MVKVEEKHFVLDDHIAGYVQSAVSKTFCTTYNIQVTPQIWKVGTDVPMPCNSLYVAQISILQGSTPLGSFVAALDRKLLVKILKMYALEESDTAFEDAVGEITNVLFGTFKAEMNREGYKLAMGLPKIRREPPTKEWNFEGQEKLLLPFSVEGKKCWIAVTYKN